MNAITQWRGIRALVLAAVAAAALASSPASAANAMSTSVSVYNGSDHDAWVDISWAYKITGWHIDKAFCLRPGESTHHGILYRSPELGPQVRVRAEIKHGDCRSGNFRVVSAHDNISTVISNATPRIQAHIQGSGGSYNVRLQISYL